MPLACAARHSPPWVCERINLLLMYGPAHIVAGRERKLSDVNSPPSQISNERTGYVQYEVIHHCPSSGFEPGRLRSGSATTATGRSITTDSACAGTGKKGHSGYP